MSGTVRVMETIGIGTERTVSVIQVVKDVETVAAR